MCLHPRVALLVLILAVTACEPVPTSPVLEEGPDVSLAAAEAADQRYVPMLSRLFEQALARVKSEKGDDVAAQVAKEYRRLAHQARSAHAAGDDEAARRAMQEAQVEAARVVSRVFPNAAERVLSVVAEHLSRRSERIAAAEASGANVTRAKEIAQRAARLHGAATEELKNGRRVPALVHATMAADLLAILRHR